MSVLRFELVDEQATEGLGKLIARALPSSSACFHVNLVGDLGAGKTTLVRGVLRALGYTGRVKSPTYPLLETYSLSDRSLNHFDLYRLETPAAFTEAGFDDYFSVPGVCFVEWPDCATGYLPLPDWVVTLTATDHGGRMVDIEARSPQGRCCLEQMA